MSKVIVRNGNVDNALKTFKQRNVKENANTIVNLARNVVSQKKKELKILVVVRETIIKPFRLFILRKGEF